MRGSWPRKCRQNLGLSLIKSVIYVMITKNIIILTYFLDNLKDEFLASKNLTFKINNGISELLFVEKKGLGALFEIQKSHDIESCQKFIRSYVEYLLQNRASYLALFIMKSHKIFNIEAATVAISNALSINSKVI